jgi:hypothetical protein
MLILNAECSKYTSLYVIFAVNCNNLYNYGTDFDDR